MLYIVSTPIGHPKDITLRALEVLQDTEYIIGEEQRVASTLLKKLNLSTKPLYVLNEHSQESDLVELLKLCEEHRVALISDCGTPSFYDPGYQLVNRCRQKNIKVSAVPGASSLMTLLSLVSQKITQFYFAGFLPADTQLRIKTFLELRTNQDAIILMDTPYRLLKLLEELNQNFTKRQLLLGVNLTQDEELVLEGTAKDLTVVLNKRGIEKAEFIILIYKNNADKIESFQNSSSKPSLRLKQQRPSSQMNTQKQKPSLSRRRRS